MNSSFPNQTMQEKQHCPPRYFSMLELLIVIAIITILSAVLLPALNKARERAFAITCISNLKQTGKMWALYFDDYDNQLPPSSLAAPYYRWPSYLIVHSGKKRVLGQDVYCLKKEDGTVIRPDAPFNCPAQRVPGEYGHFSRNFWVAGINGHSMKMIRSASRRCFVGDGLRNQPEQGVSSGAGIEKLQYALTDFRHPSRTANFLYVDGHVEGKKRSPEINWEWNNYFWGQNCKN